MAVFRIMLLVALTGSIALLSCDSDGGSSSTPLALDDYPGEFAKALCGQIFACCATDELPAITETAYADQAGCEAAVAADEASLVQTIQQAEASGRGRYGAQEAAVCLSAIRALSCGAFSTALAGGGLAACDGDEFPLVPLVAVGDACDQGFECVSGVCTGSPGAAGVCVAVPGAGQDCATVPRCVEGYYCDTTAAGGPTCAARLSNGSDCQADFECSSGFCVLEGAASTCKTLLANGVACTNDFQCQSDLCDPTASTCAANTTCGGL